MVVKDIMAGFAEGGKSFLTAFGSGAMSVGKGLGSMFKR